MKAIEHTLTHQYQPTNTSCGQTSLAIILSHYGRKLTAKQILSQLPVMTHENGEEWGTATQQLATWCLGQGFDATLYSFDFQIIDLSWAKLTKEQILGRLRLAQKVRNVASLGKEASKLYIQTYIDFLEAGGTLEIRPNVTSALLYDLLQDGPLLVCVNFNVLYNVGLTKSAGLRTHRLDDIDGMITNHFIVIYGTDKDGNLLVADPWQKPGRLTIEPERLLAAMTAAQAECDNLWIKLEDKDAV